MTKNKEYKATINANGAEISIVSKGNEDDYISLTDIAKYKNLDSPADVVKNWLRSRSTIEFLGLWEQMNNSDFKLVRILLYYRHKSGYQQQVQLELFQNLVGMVARLLIKILPLNLLLGFHQNLNFIL